MNAIVYIYCVKFKHSSRIFSLINPLHEYVSQSSLLRYLPYLPLAWLEPSRDVHCFEMVL